MKLWAGCWLIWILTAVGGAQEPQLLAPGVGDVSATHLKPYWAKYRESRKVGDQEHHTLRVTQLQALRLPEGAGWQEVIYMIGGDTVTDEWRFLAKDFAPVTRIISARSLLHKVEVFGEKVSGVAINAQGADPKPISLTMDGKRFPGTSWQYALAHRQIAKGEIYLLPVFSSDMGPAQANLFMQVKVVGRDTVKAGDGKSFNAWILENTFLDSEHQPLRMGPDPFPKSKTWLVSRPPYVVKSSWPGSETMLDSFVILPSVLME